MAPDRPPARVAQAYAWAKRRADRLIDKSAASARSVYVLGVAAVVDRVAKALRKEEAGPEDVYAAVGAVAAGLAELAGSLGAALAEGTGDALRGGARAATHLVGQLFGAAPPARESAERVARAHLRALAELRAGTAAALAADVRGAVTPQMRRLLLAPSLRREDLVALAHEALDREVWRVERLVRTETSFAYNLAQAEVLREAARAPALRGVRTRWTERVSDVTGAPLDSRVGQDSIALHGQVAPPGGTFIMPPDAAAPAAMLGKRWSHPPNRPNDRAVLTPWLPGWNVPAWVYQGGRRVYL